jgi:hypothetical protein
MSQPRPDPGATRKPPSWLVFEDDDPWLQFGSGLELLDLDRSHQLGYRLWAPQTNDIVNRRAAAEPDHALRRPGFRHGIVPRHPRKAARG